MTALRWGILATGWIATSFAHDLIAQGHQVVAVGSRTQESADAFAARFGIAQAHGSYEALAADPEVDIIYVSTPHPLHAENTKLALKNGKHALVEKAFTLTHAEAEELQALAAESGLLVMEAMRPRYMPHMDRVHEIIAAGTLGEVRAMTAEHTQSLPVDPAHRLNALELGGGALLDLGIYPISLVWDVLGAPTAIKALGRLGDTGADTEVATIMTHDNGAISTTLSSSRAAGRNGATITGTKARIEIDSVWSSPTRFEVIATDGSVLETYSEADPASSLQLEAAAAERYIAEGVRDSDRLPLAESVAIMGALDEIRRQIGVRYPHESD